MKGIVGTTNVGWRRIIQRMHHSLALQALFSGCVGDMVYCSTADSLKELKNMCSALHRFNSVLEPSATAVLVWLALNEAAFNMMTGRRGKAEVNAAWYALSKHEVIDASLHRCNIAASPCIST